jgi:hypothetical protein
MATEAILEQIPFKPGQTVGAWNPSAVGYNRLKRSKPVGAPVDTETVAADGSLKFEGLAAGDYVAAAPVDGLSDNAKAGAVTGAGVSDGGVSWVAKVAGRDGNGLSVELVDPEGNNEALAVSETAGAIEVSLATDGSGDITSTAAEVVAAVRSDPDLFELVEVAHVAGSLGTGVQEAEGPVQFAGGGVGYGLVWFHVYPEP